MPALPIQLVSPRRNAMTIVATISSQSSRPLALPVNNSYQRHEYSHSDWRFEILDHQSLIHSIPSGNSMSGGRFYGCHLLGPYSRLLSMPWPMFSQDRLSGAGALLVSGDSRTKPATQNMIVL